MSKTERTPLVGQGVNGHPVASYQTGDSAFMAIPTDGSLNAEGSSSSGDKKEVIVSARKAFQSRDAEASILYHKHKNSSHGHGQEKHGNAAGPYLKAVVYGGLDGIITTFATVTSVIGANLAPIVILIVGIAHLFADGISMGLGDAMSGQAERDYNYAERQRERWEMEVSMEQEIEEMIQLYVDRGLTRQDAETIWRILGKYPQAFLDVMMVEELHLLPPDEDEEPWKSGVVTCVAFMIFGAIPLIPFLIAPLFHWSTETQMWGAVALTVVTLFLLGAIKANLVEYGESWWKSGLTMATLGSLAASISYFVGVILKEWLNVA